MFSLIKKVIPEVVEVEWLCFLGDFVDILQVVAGKSDDGIRNRGNWFHR